MNQYVIPDDVRQFIVQHIDSIAEWEALLLLRAHPDTEWDAHTIAQRLYVSDREAGAFLAALATQGFLILRQSPEGAVYQYQPKSPELEGMLGKVADLYVQYLVPITNLIPGKSKKRFQKFADAFWLRKE